MQKFLYFTSTTSFKKVSFFRNKTFPQTTKENPRLLCTISGGNDSIVQYFLLLHLYNLAKQNFCYSRLNWDSQIKKLTIVYCQHFWQPKNFLLTLFIFRIGYLSDCPYFIVLPTKDFLNENSSRVWRKKTFFRLSQIEKVSSLTTGHTKSDLFEKNLNNLFRGTTAKSLGYLNSLELKKTQAIFFSQIFLNSKLKKFSISEFKLLPELHVLDQTRTIYFGDKTQFFVLNKSHRISKTRQKIFCFFNTQVISEKGNKVFFSFFSVSQKNISYQPYFRKIFQSSSFNFYSKYSTREIHEIKLLENLQRETISELVKVYEFPTVIDLSNFSSNYSRNKIRHQVIPLIKSLFHKRVDIKISNFLETVNSNNTELQKREYQIFLIFKLFVFNQLPLSKMDSSSESKLGKQNKKNQITLKNGYFRNQVKGQRSLLHELVSDYRNVDLTFLQLSNFQLLETN